MSTSHHLLATIISLLWLPFTASFCTWAGANPYWVGAPSVEQVTLTSVRVSWKGILRREDCADSMIIKHYKGSNTADYGMSELMPVSTKSYIVRELTPNQAYTFQVIAREEKGFLGVDYNRSPKTVYTTKKSNAVVNTNSPLPQDPDTQVYASVHSFEGDTTIAGLQLELFLGIIVGSLVVSIIVIGVIYNCVRKKEGEKDLELDSSIDSDEDDDDEDEDEDDDDDYEDEAPQARKYEMMLSDTDTKNDLKNNDGGWRDSTSKIEQYPLPDNDSWRGSHSKIEQYPSAPLQHH